MKKFATLSLGVIAAMTLVLSCGTPEPKEKPKDNPKENPDTNKTTKKAPPFTIIDHKNLAFGGDVPEWLSMEIGELEALPEYKDKYVFIFDGVGPSLEGVKQIVTKMDANSEIARYINTRVQDLFTGSKVGDDKAVETYFEAITKTLSQVEVKGYRKYKEYWVQREFADKRVDYNYRVLFTIDREEVKRMMGDALEKAPKPDTDDKTRAKNNVKKIIDGSLPVPPSGN